VKESAVPPGEIECAIQRKKRFELNPAQHRHVENANDKKTGDHYRRG
jgi:hypothetical protein